MEGQEDLTGIGRRGRKEVEGAQYIAPLWLIGACLSLVAKELGKTATRTKNKTKTAATRKIKKEVHRTHGAEILCTMRAVQIGGAV